MGTGASVATLDVDLSAGSYVLICNVVNHYSLGMYTSFAGSGYFTLTRSG